MNGPLVLIVDADRAAARVIEAILRDGHYRISITGCVREALSLMEQRLPHLVFCEIDPPRVGGFIFLSEVRARWPLIPFIVVTAALDIATAVRALKLRKVMCLMKPITPPEILGVVEKVLVPRPGPLVQRLIGGSRGIVRVLEMILIAGRSNRNVLITGETGTGKQLVAEAIHQSSDRGDRRLIEINCAAIPEALFEAELFGRAKGAYTGAETSQVGLLDTADGSAVFLDELEAMPRGHQPKLLKILEDGRLRPLGAHNDRRISVRYFAATNQDPRQLVDQGVLRRDLYHRLNEFRIDLPPLRERPEDIPLLAKHFVGDATELSSEVLDILSAYDWPGNIRHLKSVVLSAMELALAAHTAQILPQHLAHCEPAILEASPPRRAASRCGPRSLKDQERAIILQALQARDGNKSAAARDLGLPRATLHRKLLKWRLARDTDTTVSY